MVPHDHGSHCSCPRPTERWPSGLCHRATQGPGCWCPTVWDLPLQLPGGEEGDWVTGHVGSLAHGLGNDTSLRFRLRGLEGGLPWGACVGDDLGRRPVRAVAMREGQWQRGVEWCWEAMELGGGWVYLEGSPSTTCRRHGCLLEFPSPPSQLLYRVWFPGACLVFLSHLAVGPGK